jgi:ketosteroid isomerase-like protein
MNQSRTDPDEPAKATDEDEIRAASEQYRKALEALLNGDSGPMAEIWSHEDDVTTMHISGGREEGWDAVGAAFEGFAAAMTDGTAPRTDHVVRVTGDVAYELYTQEISATFAGEPLSVEGRVTNIYRKESGEWKAVHHHGDLDAELAEKVANMGA